MSAFAAQEKSVKFSHERHNLLHELNRTRSDLEASRLQWKQSQEEIVELREKMKQFHSGKLQADKRAAELMASNASIEVSVRTVINH